MSYRPYPNADRALRQLSRHYPEAPAAPVLECLQPMTESFDRLRRNVARALKRDAWHPDFLMDGHTGDVVPFPVDEYRLSTRPSIVSGGS
ncbi:hypothetical protein [Streptomyces sp. ME18-1-4]|uniref:hypothetical protein n=1 Tax=Streptomyces sp. ME18-1-4 TaxID=3028685 RepID=UPI0029A7137A|nr:hypothetical protein [Streptomyces sp. ME18-1-4]MDX3243678.1 hypothetical protein [Streptomyces sp. ME18-1-4]